MRMITTISTPMQNIKMEMKSTTMKMVLTTPRKVTPTPVIPILMKTHKTVIMIETNAKQGRTSARAIMVTTLPTSKCIMVPDMIRMRKKTTATYTDV